MIRLSAIIITKNEEANIRRCLLSVKFADEIIVIDSCSTDKTKEIAEILGARVFTHEWQGFGRAKQKGVELAAGEWILSIDADEEIPVDLANEIQQKIESPNGASAFCFKRKTMFLGRWMLHCGWYPGYVLRLFQKKDGDFDNAVVHEKVVIEGRVENLECDLLHYSYPNLETYFSKFNTYTTLGADEALKIGRRASWFDIIIKPPVSFLMHYIIRQGFRDGLEGFILSVLSSIAVLVKYAKLYTLQKGK